MPYYLMAALAAYAFTALELVQGEAPETFREVLGGVLACALVGACWPLVLGWAMCTGGVRVRSGS